MVPDITILFTIGGVPHTLRFRSLPFSVWSELKKQLGFTPGTLVEGIGTLDVEAIAAIIWLERKQTERSLVWDTVRRELEHGEVEFEFVNLRNGDEWYYESEDAPEEPENEEADPTPAGG